MCVNHKLKYRLDKFEVLRQSNKSTDDNNKKKEIEKKPIKKTNKSNQKHTNIIDKFVEKPNVLNKTQQLLNAILETSQSKFDKNIYKSTNIIINDNLSISSDTHEPKLKIYKCICNKTFSCSQNLSRHKKTCNHAKSKLVTIDQSEYIELKQHIQDLKDGIKDAVKNAASLFNN